MDEEDIPPWQLTCIYVYNSGILMYELVDFQNWIVYELIYAYVAA